MSAPDTLVTLDSLRADTMRRLLNETGQREIWKYDVVEARVALAEALGRYNFDGITTGIEARKAGTLYALIGPSIEDQYFSTPGELIALAEWLCRDGGPLSCYAAQESQERVR